MSDSSISNNAPKINSASPVAPAASPAPKKIDAKTGPQDTLEGSSAKKTPAAPGRLAGLKLAGKVAGGAVVGGGLVAFAGYGMFAAAPHISALFGVIAAAPATVPILATVGAVLAAVAIVLVIRKVYKTIQKNKLAAAELAAVKADVATLTDSKKTAALTAAAAPEKAAQAPNAASLSRSSSQASLSPTELSAQRFVNSGAPAEVAIGIADARAKLPEYERYFANLTAADYASPAKKAEIDETQSNFNYCKALLAQAPDLAVAV